MVNSPLIRPAISWGVWHWGCPLRFLWGNPREKRVSIRQISEGVGFSSRPPPNYPDQNPSTGLSTNSKFTTYQLDFFVNSKWTYERPPKPPTIRNSFTRTLVLDTIMKLSGTIGVTQKTMTLIHIFADFWIWRHSSSKLISARNEASKNIQKLCAKKKRYHAQNEHTSKIRKWKTTQNDDQNDDRTIPFQPRPFADVIGLVRCSYSIKTLTDQNAYQQKPLPKKYQKRYH